MNGYRVKCSVCGRSRMSSHSPMKRGWPVCCSYRMTLVDTKKFIANVDAEVSKSFANTREPTP